MDEIEDLLGQDQFGPGSGRTLHTIKLLVIYMVSLAMQVRIGFW